MHISFLTLLDIIRGSSFVGLLVRLRILFLDSSQAFTVARSSDYSSDCVSLFLCSSMAFAAAHSLDYSLDHASIILRSSTSFAAPRSSVCSSDCPSCFYTRCRFLPRLAHRITRQIACLFSYTRRWLQRWFAHCNAPFIARRVTFHFCSSTTIPFIHAQQCLLMAFKTVCAPELSNSFMYSKFLALVDSFE